MQQYNTWQDKGPGKETSKPRQKMQTDKTQKTRKQERQEKKFFFSKKVHSKSCGFRPKSRKAASLQTADGFIFYMSTYDFCTSGHFDNQMCKNENYT